MATTPKIASMERFSKKKFATVQRRFGSWNASATRMKSVSKNDSPFLFQSLSVICEIQPPPPPSSTSFQK